MRKNYCAQTKMARIDGSIFKTLLGVLQKVELLILMIWIKPKPPPPAPLDKQQKWIFME